jgi:hypothetical protein
VVFAEQVQHFPCSANLVLVALLLLCFFFVSVSCSPIQLRGVAPGVTRSDWRSQSPPESK